MWGVLDGIHLVKHLKLSKVEFQVDNVNVFKDILSDKPYQKVGLHLVRSIQDELKSCVNYHFKIILREANSCVDQLANANLNSKISDCTFDFCPAFLLGFVQHDVAGIG